MVYLGNNFSKFFNVIASTYYLLLIKMY